MGGWFGLDGIPEISDQYAVKPVTTDGFEPVTFIETSGLFPVIGYVQADEWRAAVDELPR